MAAKKKTANIEVPKFTIRADSPAGMAMMVAVYGLPLDLSAEQRQAIADKMREFELYEEQTRS